MASIKNILFDLGGVILHLDRQAALDAFIDLGFNNVETVLRNFRQSGTFLKFEDGSIDSSTFRKEIRAHIGHYVADDDIDKAWGKMTTHVEADTLQLLLDLRKKYKTYLLSNTNPIHISICDPMFSFNSHNGFDAFFDQCFYSYQLKVCKPDHHSFTKVCDNAGILPNETLFIDDSVDNLNAASKLGFKTLQVSTPYQLRKKLVEHGII